MPGPGTYENLKVICREARKFTFGPKTIFNDPSDIEKKKNVPGPGYYPNKLGFDKFGKYCISTYYNSKAPNFSPSLWFKTINR